jgi:hypothetical protein
MMPRVMDARHAGKYRVWLRFDDGLSGEIGLEDELWGSVFDPLKDVAEFSHSRPIQSWKPLCGPTVPTLRPSSSTTA